MSVIDSAIEIYTRFESVPNEFCAGRMRRYLRDKGVNYSLKPVIERLITPTEARKIKASHQSHIIVTIEEARMVISPSRGCLGTRFRVLSKVQWEKHFPPDATEERRWL